MTIDKITISKFSALTKLSSKALRLYDKKELLEPSERDPVNNYRYYSTDQLEDAIRIKLLSSIGFGIDEMKTILDAVASHDEDFLKDILRRKRSEIQLEINRLQRIEEIISAESPLDLMYRQCSDPEVKIVPKTRVISTRRFGNYSRDVPQMIDLLMGTLHSEENMSQHLRIAGPIMLLVHDREYKDEGADIEIAIPIVGQINVPAEDINVMTLPEVTVVSLIYTGPYADVGIGYSKAFNYAYESGYEPVHGAREIYLNSPQEVSEDQLMTELQILVDKVEESL